LVEFSGFSSVGIISGTTVMARRTGRWDRGVREIPNVVADNGVWRHAVGDGGPSDGGQCWRDSRHARRGKERGKR
jgi:hypothetical protein